MGFVMPHVIIMVATVVVAVALLLQIVGLATTGWASTVLPSASGNLDVSMGLWRTCKGDDCSDFECVSDYLGACRAFGILAVLALVGSVVCAVLICFLSSLKILPLVAMGCAAGGGFCALLEFAVFAGEGPSVYTDHLSYSFYLTIGACVLAVGAAVLFFVGKRKSAVE